MKRSFDLVLGLILIVLFSIPMILVAFSIRLTSNGPILYWSQRIGKYNKIFEMPKFRTMIITTPEVATHLVQNPKKYLTPIGGFLRKYSLDELPQLFSIIKNDMSFVGPRPALFNQVDLINKRNDFEIEKILPGLTGWAQINGRDDISLEEKVILDFEYFKKSSFCFDLLILWLTFIKVIKRDGISH